MIDPGGQSYTRRNSFTRLKLELTPGQFKLSSSKLADATLCGRPDGDVCRKAAHKHYVFVADWSAQRCGGSRTHTKLTPGVNLV